jgi:hypothetical protein
VAEGVVMDTVTRSSSEPGTRWKVHRFERFLTRHTDSLTERFGAVEADIWAARCSTSTAP